jgi:tetratricopeptide (TPR) repeat protein
MVGQQWREAETLAVRAASLGVNPLLLGTAALAQMSQGRYTEAQATMHRLARIAQHTAAFLLGRFALEASHGDYTAAEQDLRELRGEQPRSAAWQAEGSSWLAWLDEVRGRLAQAARDLDEFMATSEQRGLPRDYLSGAIWRGLLDVRYRHRPLDGLNTVEAALRHHPLGSMSSLDRPYLALAEFYAEAGRPEVARRLLAEYEKLVPEPKWGLAQRLAVLGAIALAEGRAQDAVLAYRALTEHDETPIPTEGLFELATAYERAGRADSAQAVYDRSVSTPGLRTPVWISIDNYVGEAHGLAPALMRLGALYDERGDRAKARDYYSRFADLWKDADPELQSYVAQARAALKRLCGEPR